MAVGGLFVAHGPVKPARPPQDRGPGAGSGLSRSEQVEDVPDVGPPARRVALDVGSISGERGTRQSRAAPSPRSRRESTGRPPAAGRATRRSPSFRARIQDDERDVARCGASRRRSHRNAGSVDASDPSTAPTSPPTSSWSRQAALGGDRRRANRDPSRPGPVKIPAAPGVSVGSRHTGRGSGRRANLQVASMAGAGPAPLAPTYTWCQSCGLRYALALPKRPRLCNRCGGSNPEDEGGAPETKRARNA